MTDGHVAGMGLNRESVVWTERSVLEHMWAGWTLNVQRGRHDVVSGLLSKGFAVPARKKIDDGALLSKLMDEGLILPRLKRWWDGTDCRITDKGLALLGLPSEAEMMRVEITRKTGTESSSEAVG